MKTAAIICEYNPLHCGHKYHIEETRRRTGAQAIIAIMSGNFVQRGDAALYRREARAKAAVLCGADLVLELPTVYSCASAEFFARGAVEVLNALHSVDLLSFGAEVADAEALMHAAKGLANEPSCFTSSLKEGISSGLSFPAARARAVSKTLGEPYARLLSSPNNILGVEYCKALILSNSKILPFPIPRTGTAHDSSDPCGAYASAAYIRSLISDGGLSAACGLIPAPAADIFKDEPIHSIKELEKAIICCLIKMPAEELKKISDVSEGLENRIKKAALCSSSLDELFEQIKTKRYTLSRIRRIVLSAFLGITDLDRRTSPSYIRVLAHNEIGQRLISTAKKTSALPIVRNTSQVNRLGDEKVKALWERERMFDSLYAMSELKP